MSLGLLRFLERLFKTEEALKIGFRTSWAKTQYRWALSINWDIIVPGWLEFSSPSRAWARSAGEPRLLAEGRTSFLITRLGGELGAWRSLVLETTAVLARAF